MSEKLNELSELLNILNLLRENCPWDKDQTMESLRNLTIEECFELCDAIDNQDQENIKEELGDVLLHVLFYSKIAEEKGWFNILDVANSQVKKLKFRHPHIFSDTKVNSIDDVIFNWDELKKIEKQGKRDSVFSGIPNSLSAILKADKIQKKVGKLGFEWEDKNDVWDKVIEELEEVRDAIENKQKEDVEEEFGDLMFAVINATRMYGFSAETTLEKCNKKFMKRFELMESLAHQKGNKLKGASLAEMEELWQEAKSIIKNKTLKE